MHTGECDLLQQALYELGLLLLQSERLTVDDIPMHEGELTQDDSLL
jgi:hypothetical protein